MSRSTDGDAYEIRDALEAGSRCRFQCDIGGSGLIQLREDDFARRHRVVPANPCMGVLPYAYRTSYLPARTRSLKAPANCNDTCGSLLDRLVLHTHGTFPDLYIPRQGLESLTVVLHNGYGQVSGLTRVNILNTPELSSVRATNNVAIITMLHGSYCCCLHAIPLLALPISVVP